MISEARASEDQYSYSYVHICTCIVFPIRTDIRTSICLPVGSFASMSNLYLSKILRFVYLLDGHVGCIVQASRLESFREKLSITTA